MEDRNRRSVQRIRVIEIKNALKKMKMGKVLGPDGISIEIWKCLGDLGLYQLTNLFNEVLSVNKMPIEQKKYFNTYLQEQGDNQNYTNYHGIKLISHIMELQERVIEHRLRWETTISEN